MSNYIIDKQDLVVIGGGTSGIMCALGALHYGFKVTLICNNSECSSSLSTEIIPTKAFSYCANLAHSIKNASKFGLDVQLGEINLNKIRSYINNITQDLHHEKDIDNFEKLGGHLIIGNPMFIDPYTIVVGNKKLISKYFIIATGIRETTNNILNLQKSDFITYKQIFSPNTKIILRKIIILGGRIETLEIAQSLARLGSKVVIIFNQNNLLPLDDQELVKKLKTILEQEGITFYFSSKVLEFYRQHQRKLLICQDLNGNRFAIDGDEIIDMQTTTPNVEGLGLTNASVKYSKEGILVNNKLQTTQKNIFSLGSVIKNQFKSVHTMEYQTNIILSNIIFKIPRKIDYQLIPRVIYTYPQLATLGKTRILPSAINNIEILQFDFKDIDAAIYQQNCAGEIKLICKNNKLLGVSILGPLATEIITEFNLILQLGADVSEVAKSIHCYPSLSQINKRVAHKIFNQKSNTPTANFEKALIKLQRVFTGFSFAN